MVFLVFSYSQKIGKGLFVLVCVGLMMNEDSRMRLHNKLHTSQGHHEQKCDEDVFENFKILTSPLSYHVG